MEDTERRKEIKQIDNNAKAIVIENKVSLVKKKS